MADKNFAEVAAKALRLVGRNVLELAPEVLEVALKGTVAGVVAGFVAKKVKEYVETQDEAKKAQIKKELEESKEYKELKEKAAQEEFQPNQNNKYMDCVIFAAKEGLSLSEDDQNLLADVLYGEVEASEQAKPIVDGLYDKVGGTMRINYCSDPDVGDADCYIGADYFSVNFSEYDDIPYDEQYVKELMDGINKIVGKEIFGDYLIYGRDEELWGG